MIIHLGNLVRAKEILKEYINEILGKPNKMKKLNKNNKGN